MPPKKKEKKKEAADDDEDKGPTIWSELLTKQVPEIETHLDAPVAKINTENVEFESLVQKLQDDIKRFQADNERLAKKSKITQEEIKKDSLQRNFEQKGHVNERSKQIESKIEQAKLYTIAEQEGRRQDIKFQDDMLKNEELHQEKMANMRDQFEEMSEQHNALLQFKEKRDDYIAERDSWQVKLDAQRQKHAKQIEDIETEKVKEIEKLRKEMLQQIRNVKVLMLNQNEDQLQGTTKLTVIQNAQLTGELEYQSKQTEHLMFKNGEMQSLIRNLKRDLSDHQEVERELAKRSHFCQKVIAKYKSQSKELQEQINESKALRKKLLSGEQPQHQRDESDLLEYLNERIAAYEIRLKQTSKHLLAQEQEYVHLIDKVLTIKAKYTRCDLLLTEFIEHFVNQDQDLLNRQADIFLDIDQIKEATDFKAIPPQSLVALCLVLRKQLQPYITELSKAQTQHSYQRHIVLKDKNQGSSDFQGNVAGKSTMMQIGGQETGNPGSFRGNRDHLSSEVTSQDAMVRKANVTISTRDDDQALAFNKQDPNRKTRDGNQSLGRGSMGQGTGHRDMNSTEYSRGMMGSRGTYRLNTADNQSFTGAGGRATRHPPTAGVLSMHEYQMSPGDQNNLMNHQFGGVNQFGQQMADPMAQTQMQGANKTLSPEQVFAGAGGPGHLNPIQQQQLYYARKPNTTERMPYYMNLRKRQNQGIGQVGLSLDRAGGMGRPGMGRVGGGIINEPHYPQTAHIAQHIDQAEGQGHSRFRYNSSSIPYMHRGLGSVGQKRRQNNINYMNAGIGMGNQGAEYYQQHMPKTQQPFDMGMGMGDQVYRVDNLIHGPPPHLMASKENRVDSPSTQVGVKPQLASIQQPNKGFDTANSLPGI